MPHDQFILTLADGTCLTLRAGDEVAERVVTFFVEVARLAPTPPSPPPGARHLLAVAGVAQGDGGRSRYVGPASGAPAGASDEIVCVLDPTDMQRPRRRRRNDVEGGVHLVFEPLTEEQWFWRQLVRLSACVGREVQARGGVLLHSGLAEASPSIPPRARGGCGVLLAGRSGVGKSTASRRIPPPWRALADDMTLVVRDVSGAYRAHPWPTWSRFFGEEAGDGSDSWDVQQSVALRAIVVLEQGEVDRIEPLGPGHAVALLAELAQQTSRHLLHDLSLDELAAFNLQRFENLCALVRAVPAHLLHVSLDGAFWAEIERVLS